MTDAPDDSEVDAEDEQFDEQNEQQGEEQIDEHLQNIDDGAGCTEIWEHLSENRESDA